MSTKRVMVCAAVALGVTVAAWFQGACAAERGRGRIVAGKRIYRAKDRPAWRDRGRILGFAPRAPRFQVEAINPAGKIIEWTIVPAGEGIYELEWVRPGTYTLRFRAKGYADLALKEVQVKAGHDLYINLEFAARRAKTERGDEGEVRRDGDREHPERADGDREHPERADGDREHAERRDGDREHPERADGDREHAERRDGDREHAERANGDREHAERRDGDRQHAERRDGDREHAEGEVRRDGDGEGRVREGAEKARLTDPRPRGYLIGTVASVARDAIVLKVSRVLTRGRDEAKGSKSVKGRGVPIRFLRQLSGEDLEKARTWQKKRTLVVADVFGVREKKGLFARRVVPVVEGAERD